MTEAAGDIATRALETELSPNNSGNLANSPSEPQERKTIDRLFMRLAAIYGHRWMSVFPTEAATNVAKAEWAQQLAGLDFDALRRGMARLDDRPRKDRYWPPSAVEFYDLCLPTYEDFGMPDPEDAFIEASNGLSYSHAAVFWARSRCRHWVVDGTAKEARAHFFPAYEQALEMAQQGYEFPEPPKANRQVTHKPTPGNPEVARRHLQELKQAIGSNSSDG